MAQKAAALPKLGRRIQDLDAFNPTAVRDREDPTIRALELSIDKTLVDVFGHDTVEYRRYRRAANLDRAGLSMGYPTPIQEVREGFEDGKNDALATLREVVRGFEEDIEDGALDERVQGEARAPQEARPAPSDRVFVVHGRHEGARESVARFLAKLGLDPVILHEQANQGRTIIEKLGAIADVGFAVVILSPDDVGASAADLPVGSAEERLSALRSRARQNVVFELGLFMGRLGRDRVCILNTGDLEVFADFSDAHGVVYERWDGGQGWKLALAKELKAAGYEVDFNRVFE